LPADIAVQSLAQAKPRFHPRFDAVARWYRYSIYNAPVRSPLVRHASLHVPGALDVDKMRKAADMLVGEHDFATFGQPPQGCVTVRRVQRACWIADPPWAWFDIEANAFLYHMVRSVVGTLLLVGEGRLSVDAFRNKLVAADRSESGPTAPSCGLCLLAVRY
jgi:tRNA pseudouridine38-40 synthase